MSKLHDALLKAERQEALRRKEGRPLKSVPRVESSGPENQVEQKTPFQSLDISPEAALPRAPGRPLTDRERLASCVVVEGFIANPNSLMAEQFRKLRSVITTQGMAGSLRSVLITSCVPGEGKTTVTLNLSAIIAQGLDNSVILIDADLRRLSLTSLLGLRNAPGLLDILEQKATIEDTLVETEIEGLTIIPGGVSPANPAELVGSTRMWSLIQEFNEKYRDSYIMIDATPIISTSEAHVLSQMVDGVIVVILADETRRDVVKREIKLINQDKILGVVLNCAEFETSGYSGKHYRQYYGKEDA